MKKVIWVVLLAVVVGFFAVSKDPLNDTVNFLIAGSIPGTNISVGFWSTMALVSLLVIVIYRGIKSAQHRMIVSEVERVKAKRVSKVITQKSDDSSEIEFDRSKRSVIAAQSTESVL